jgi:FimV-like protein
MHNPKLAPDLPHIAPLAQASPRAGRLHWGGVAFAVLVLALPGTALTQPAGDTSAPGASYTTVANDSVWRLAGLALGSSRGDRAQAMAAILRLNPDAFMQGNLHRLKRGVTITLPSPEAIAAEDARQASMLLESHLQALAVPGVLASPPPPLGHEAGAAASRPVAKAAPTPTPAPVPTPTPVPAPVVKAPVAAAPASVATARTPVAPVPSPTPAVMPPVAVAPAPASTPATASGASAGSASSAATATTALQPASTPAVAEPTPVAASAQPSVAAPPQPAVKAPTAPAESGLGLVTRLLPYAMLLLLLALPLAWWVYRQRTRAGQSTRERLRAASTDFQDSKDGSRGLKPRRVDVSNAGVDVARVVETLGPVTLLVKQDGHDPLPGAAPLSMAEIREQAGLKLEIARASLEIGRAMVARTLLAAVQREGDAAERQAADELMLKLA